MKMYHVSLDIFNNIEKFSPKIPDKIAKNENNTIPRVCISDSIVNCLNGLLYYENYFRKISMDSETNYFLLEEGCERILKVYEFEIDEKELVFPNYIFKNNLVSDALENNEYWSLKELEPIHSYCIKINGFPETKEGTLCKDNYRYEILKSIDYSLINDKDISREAKLYFNVISSDVLENFNSDENLLFNITNIDDNCVEISIDKYPVLRNTLKDILDKCFSWYEHYLGVEII